MARGEELMGAWRGSFYGLLLEGARMDRLGEGEARITPIDEMIENIYSPFLWLSVMLRAG
ncbi:MAG: hypothetical protein DBX00_12470 [Verrucomicrobia bacterium]|jgi:hypothetical protein|nr:hypothetical protein [Roseibacillus sp.]RCL33174.1 MAG: hypothetical protein DBX00_12470 [Verrucomicrobiota bacterium]|tara:strand:- start:831 stop:1010 length:180 start_codon:yes stop_codon:yes gene_type:complete